MIISFDVITCFMLSVADWCPGLMCSHQRHSQAAQRHGSLCPRGLATPVCHRENRLRPLSPLSCYPFSRPERDLGAESEDYHGARWTSRTGSDSSAADTHPSSRSASQQPPRQQQPRTSCGYRQGLTCASLFFHVCPGRGAACCPLPLPPPPCSL